MVRSDPLSDPTVAGLSDTTRIRYPVPAGVAPGIIAVIVPEFAVEASVPATVGAAKDPVASESSAE